MFRVSMARSMCSISHKEKGDVSVLHIFGKQGNAF